MKTKILISLTIIILVGFLLIGGCATTARITEPTSPGSTLLIGRIKATCSEFPHMWHANGDHTNGVMLDVKSVLTNKIISIKARGADGLFYLVDPDIGLHEIVRFQLHVGTSRTTLDLYYNTRIPFQITRNSVNNFGDILWQCDYITKEYTDYSRKGSYTLMNVNNSHKYVGNYNEVKAWFEETYPESAWNHKNWINAR